MADTDPKKGGADKPAPDDEVWARAKEKMAQRAARYGIDPARLQKLPSLEVKRSMRLSSTDNSCVGVENVQTITVNSYERLKEIMGTPQRACARMVGGDSYEYKAGQLLEAAAKYRDSGRNYSGIVRRLAWHYLYEDVGKYETEIVGVLKAWRELLKRIKLYPLWDIIVYSGQTLTIASNIQVLWVNRVIIHRGGRLRTQGHLRIDAYRMESY